MDKRSTGAKRGGEIDILKDGVYQFKITLLGMGRGEVVWRRIQVPINITFARFHRIIGNAMGWKGGSLHQGWV